MSAFVGDALISYENCRWTDLTVYINEAERADAMYTCMLLTNEMYRNWSFPSDPWHLGDLLLLILLALAWHVSEGFICKTNNAKLIRTKKWVEIMLKGGEGRRGYSPSLAAQPDDSLKKNC